MSLFSQNIFFHNLTLSEHQTDVLVETHNRSKAEKRIEIEIENNNMDSNQE